MQHVTVDDFDGENERAWTDFETACGDVVEALDEGESLALSLVVTTDPQADSALYALIARLAQNHWRAELLHGGSASRRPLAAEAHEFLGARGWVSRGDFDLAYERHASQGTELVEPLVEVLRTVLGIHHPAFITTSGRDEAVALGVAPPSTLVTEPTPEDREEVASPLPRDHDDLVDLVGHALRDLIEPEVLQDDDDDFVLIHERHVVHVRVLGEVPVTTICSDLIGDVEDLGAAHREVGILNRQRGWTRFLISDSTIQMKIEIPCLPFVQAHLEAALKLGFLTISEVADDLLLRVGGTFPYASLIEAWAEQDEEEDEESYDEDEHGEEWLRSNVFSKPDNSWIQRLFDRDLHGRAHVEPELIAAACDNDPAVLHSLIPQIREQEVTWSASRTLALEGDDPAEAARSARWRVRWTATGEAVQRALDLFPEWSPALPKTLPPKPAAMRWNQR